jgi:hypothetical protein
MQCCVLAGLGEGPGSLSIPLRVSRGAQRAIGSKMGATPLGKLPNSLLSALTLAVSALSSLRFSAWLAVMDINLSIASSTCGWCLISFFAAVFIYVASST